MAKHQWVYKAKQNLRAKEKVIVIKQHFSPHLPILSKCYKITI